MKSLIHAVIAASVLAAPLVSFAQSDSSLTRAQVRSELKQLEAAGYTPGSGDEENYPANIQAAEARIAPNGATGYGGAISGSSASGGGTAVRPASPAEMNKLYSGGQ